MRYEKFAEMCNSLLLDWDDFDEDGNGRVFHDEDEEGVEVFRDEVGDITLNTNVVNQRWHWETYANGGCNAKDDILLYNVLERYAEIQDEKMMDFVNNITKGIEE